VHWRDRYRPRDPGSRCLERKVVPNRHIDGAMIEGNLLSSRVGDYSIFKISCIISKRLAMHAATEASAPNDNDHGIVPTPLCGPKAKLNPPKHQIL